MKAIFESCCCCCFGSKDATPQPGPRIVAAGSPTAGRSSPHLSTASTLALNTRRTSLAAAVQSAPAAPAGPSQAWEKAFLSLPAHDRQTLDFGAADRVALLREVLELTEEKRNLCLQQQWKIPLGGRNINLRDTADALCARVHKFVLIGDIVVQYDPVHAALPWAAFRFLLQVCIVSTLLCSLLFYSILF